jgi:anti-sigma factor RsiW
MTETPISLHPDDGDIIRWMDDEASPAERATLEIHLASCATCRERRDLLARRRSRLTALLRATDTPAPSTSLRPVIRRRKERSTIPWKVAATILLMVGAASAVTPVRAWFASVARAVLANFRHAPTAAAPSEGSVSFVPATAQLTIDVPAKPGTTLTVEVVDGDRVTAVGGGTGVLVLPDELRFTGAGNANGQYVVKIPLRTESVRILIGPTTVRLLKPKSVGDRWSIPLDPLAGQSPARQ